MIVDEINIARLLVFESKRHSPIAGYIHRPEAIQASLQRVEAQAWEVHVGGLARRIEPRQQRPDAFQLGGIVVM